MENLTKSEPTPAGHEKDSDNGKVPRRANAEEIAERRKGKSKSNVMADAVDFRQIVRDNTHMADNTLFLEQIWNEKENVSFFFPRRFCKTTLLSMTNFFLNIEVDEETGLPLKNQWTEDRQKFKEKFKNAKILAPQDLLSKMVGKRVCIHFSFKHTNVKDMDELLDEFREKFSNLFKKYSWLEKHLDKAKKKKFVRTKSGNKSVTITDLKYALSLLSGWLKEHFINMLKKYPDEMADYKKEDFEQILIIMDNFNPTYNPLLRSTPNKKELKSMTGFFEGIITATFDDNSDVRGILAGYFPTTKHANFQKITILRAGDYAEYFGFNQNHFQYLCDAFEVNEEDRNRAKIWYNGYTIHGYNQQRPNVYNPQNIVHFLEDRKNQPTIPFDPRGIQELKETFDIDGLSALFNKPSIVEKIQALLKIKPNVETEIEIEMPLLSNLDTSNIDALCAAANDKNFEKTEAIEKLFFTFLLYAGYIDAKDRSEYSTYSLDIVYKISVPNYLHRQELWRRIQIFYEQKYKDFYNYIPAAQKALANFYQTGAKNDIPVEVLEKAKNEFKNKLQEVVTNMPGHWDINMACSPDTIGFDKNERIFHVLIDHMSMSLYNTSLFGTEIYCTCPPRFYANETQIRADTSFIDFKSKIGIQIEHKCDENVEDALRQSTTYFNIFEQHLENNCITKVLFVGTNFSSKGKPLELNFFLYEHEDGESKQKLKQLQKGPPKGTRPDLPRDAKMRNVLSLEQLKFISS